MNEKRKRNILYILENESMILFFVLSVLCLFIEEGSWADHESGASLFINSIMNLAVMLVFFVSRLIMGKTDLAEQIIYGMLLFVVYNLLPVFILVNLIVIKVVTAAVVASALFAFFAGQQGKARVVLSLKKPMKKGFSLVILVFSLIFIGRGLGYIRGFTSGTASISDFAVSMADLAVCSIWLYSSVRSLVSKDSAGTLIPVFFQASLLFLTLAIYLVVRPLSVPEPVALADVAVVLVMGLFFIIPLIILLRLATGKVRPSGIKLVKK